MIMVWRLRILVLLGALATTAGCANSVPLRTPIAVTPVPSVVVSAAPPGASAAPVDALNCAASGDVATAVPQRTWAAVAICPLPSVPDGPSPGPSAVPPTIVHGDLAPLVTALRTPDAPRTRGVCPDYAILLPRFWLVDGDGDAFAPRVPVGPCGQPTTAVVTALHALQPGN